MIWLKEWDAIKVLEFFKTEWDEWEGRMHLEWSRDEITQWDRGKRWIEDEGMTQMHWLNQNRCFWVFDDVLMLDEALLDTNDVVMWIEWVLNDDVMMWR